MDYAHEQTDKRLAEMERQVAAVYREAADETRDKLETWYAAFLQEDESRASKVKSGELSRADYLAWRRDEMLDGKRLKALTKRLVSDYVNADQKALEIVAGEAPEVFALNANFTAYTIEQQGGDVTWTLYDRQTVNRLIREKPELLPIPALDVPRDMRWNQQHITSAITQGILQGDAIPEIAGRLLRVAEMDYHTAIRSARTATTAAECAGRAHVYKVAEAMGIKLKKQWLATLDNRTRHAHAMLDGQTVDTDKPFKVDGQEIMYPGDRTAPGYLIYNCRCTMVAVVEDVDTSDALRRTRNPVTGQSELVADMTYQEWAGWKEKEQKTVAKSVQSGTIRLPDIQIGRSVGAKAKNYDVMDLSTGEMFQFVEGTRIQNVEVFAGKGSSDVYRNAYKYANRYGGKVEDWQHVKGFAWLTTDDGDRKAEIHWSQCEGFGKHDFFVKKWLGD